MKKLKAALLALVLLVSCLVGCGSDVALNNSQPGSSAATAQAPVDGVWEPNAEIPFTVEDIPAYTGDAYVAINDNVPFFDLNNIPAASVEYYSDLDDLGRCGVTYACVGQDIMPTEKRGNIGQVKPTGWQTAKYDSVDGKYLYNRCHLIGYQLTAENANKSNLITGTRYLNIDAMLPFENMVADYVKETNNHVAYRVTPIFDGDDLVAQGVLMEGYSVEDAGEEVMFCVFAYNVQPQITIDYATGESWLSEDGPAQPDAESTTYVLNTSSKKFHKENCSGVDSIKKENRKTYTGSREDLISEGYEPCQRCKP